MQVRRQCRFPTVPDDAKVVYTEGVFDLLHINHVQFLEEAKKHGDFLLVGVCADFLVSTYKRKPVICEQERLYLIEALKVTDAAFITVDPFVPETTIKYINEFNLHALVYGSPGFEEYYQPAIDKGIFRRLVYRQGQSTSGIRSRMASSQTEF